MADSSHTLPRGPSREEKRRLRQQRQNMRNLVASLVVSLAIVALLILVIPRPGGNQVAPIDWQAIAGESQISAPGPLAVPKLDETWQANRADIREINGTTEWTIGLISSTDDFVQIIQGFDAAESWVSTQVRGRMAEGESTLGAGATPVTWTVYDRSEVPNPGNRVWAVATPSGDGWIVVTGISQASVLLVASDLSTNSRFLFPEDQ
jgi:hypothetical protein